MCLVRDVCTVQLGLHEPFPVDYLVHLCSRINYAQVVSAHLFVYYLQSVFIR